MLGLILEKAMAAAKAGLEKRRAAIDKELAQISRDMDALRGDHKEGDSCGDPMDGCAPLPIPLRPW